MMLGLLCVAAVPAQLFLSPAAMPRHAATGTLRAPAAVADLSRAERDALMQQLQAQLKDAVEQVEKEVTVGQVEFSKKSIYQTRLKSIYTIFALIVQ